MAKKKPKEAPPAASEPAEAPSSKTVKAILTAAGKDFDWQQLARAAARRWTCGDGSSLSECSTGTYFYAVRDGGFVGHMGEWTTAVQNAVREDRKASRAPTPPDAPRDARDAIPPPAPEPAPNSSSLDDIGAWLEEL